MIEDNIADIEKDILDAIGGYEQTVPKQLATLISQVNNELKSGNFKNRTGELRRSMRAILTDQGLSVSMLDYGYYLSFGVDGKNRSSAMGVTDDVATAFGVKTGYKFGSDKVWGIAPRKFYPLDLEERLLDILLTEE